MLRFWLAALLMMPTLACAQSPTSPPNRPELRAFWVDGFNDGFKTPAQCDALLARVRACHLNAVFVQMRKRGDAYYASHYEPWAADDPQQFDALAYLCAHAHAPGQSYVQVHAWVNACAVGGSRNPRGIAQTHPEWDSLSDTGARYDDEATKIDPGNPAAADWTTRVYLDIVRHYDIDGIHLDFIRYGGSGKTVGHWGYNPVSVARYNARYGTTGQPAWNDSRWCQWRRDQVTALVRRIYVSATALKPKLIVSAATICWGDPPKDDADYEARSASYTEVFAPWRDWLREGILDLNCPMTYFSLPKREDRWQGWAMFVKDHQYGRVSAMGVGSWINAPDQTYRMIASTRQPTVQGNAAAGVVLFSYAGTDTTNGQENQYTEGFYDDLIQPTVFPGDVPLPAMPWKEKPKTGALMGVILAGEHLIPVDGANVTVENKARQLKYHAVSDANGFFALTGLPPGRYMVVVPSGSHGSIPDFLIAHRRVELGSAAFSPYIFADNLVFHVAGVGKRQTAATVCLANAVVTSGSDRLGDDFYVADGFGKPSLRVHSPGLSPPTVMGDIVTVSGKIEHSPGGAALNATAVRYLGATLVRPDAIGSSVAPRRRSAASRQSSPR